jgi:hypothetical protein
MKKLLLMLIVALIPSMIFATTTTATIGGTLKVYETLSISSVRDMVFPAQYAGITAGVLYSNTGQPAANGITGTATTGQAGSVIVIGTGGTQFTPSLGAFTFTAGPSNLTALSTATTVALCAVDPPIGASQCGGLSAQTLGSPGNPGQSIQMFVQGRIAAGVTLVAGTHTGTVVFTATY